VLVPLRGAPGAVAHKAGWQLSVTAHPVAVHVAVAVAAAPLIGHRATPWQVPSTAVGVAQLEAQAYVAPVDAQAVV
jgi:hypothetical protein